MINRVHLLTAKTWKSPGSLTLARLTRIRSSPVDRVGHPNLSLSDAAAVFRAKRVADGAKRLDLERLEADRPGAEQSG
jgi:hypothetical protein